ncbi:hypothetical protein B0T19DRAFT_444027 [Cercophora scortea]|uniref:Galactose oxidase n=1 Tax=Cercophora scortea TaxID=314031 RepID=A0AAE0IGS2_9PEZI|nr:hypothetical protein B0T19DRAFT_444027 [Cercophora scortea]
MPSTWTPLRLRLRLRPVLAALVSTALAAAAAGTPPPSLPYTPTTILLSGPVTSNTTTTAYIFTPGANGASADLLAIDISSHLTSDALHAQTLTSGLPFLASGTGSNHTSFIPSLLDNGTIAILAGNCAATDPASAGAVWTYTDSSGWKQHTTTSSDPNSPVPGPYLLGSSLTFSSQLLPTPSDPVLYIYGGMCPFANTTSTTWQSAAAYSNRMLRISSSPSSGGKTGFSAEYTSSAGPPIAEAGFSFTPLAPSLTNRSGGIVTQQTGHVLLGGHTQHAFINISTVAVWSLPEETWSFVDINPPSGSLTGTVNGGKMDLAVKDTTTFASEGGGVVDVGGRSGHTAVLSEDGTYLVIFGGWYGETNQAATPQLAVVKIGVSLTDWEWFIPASAQPSGVGIYGHGAAVLPGNVMMVYGGYEITPTGGSARLKSRETATRQMFLNITSMTWSAEYTNPNYSPSETGTTTGSTTTSSSTKAVGLGIGLGLGVPLLLVLCFIAICLRRRQQRRRAQRDEALRGLAQGMRGGTFPASSEGDAMLERDDHLGGGMFPWNATSARDWYTGGSDPYVQGQRSLGYETLRGAAARNNHGPSVYMPAPPMAAAPGRPRNARGLYQPTTGLSGAGKEEEDGDDGGISPERDEVEHDGEDPFQTPRGGVTPKTSSSAMPPRGQDPEVQGWVSDVDAADAVLSARISRHGSTTTTPPATHSAAGQPTPTTPTRLSHGRISPTRRASVKNNNPASSSNGSITTTETDETRTGSNLSDRSAFSFVQGAERTATLSPPRSSLPVASRAALLVADSKPGSSGSGSSGSSSHHTFSTAKSTFGTLQAEGPSLLLGSGGVKRRSYAADEGGYYKYTSGDGDIDREEETGGGSEMMIEDDYVDLPGSPSKSKPPRRSWFGSLRRVFSGATPSPEGSSGAGSPTRESLLDSSGADYYEGKLGASGGTLLRRKQGREAWEEGMEGAPRDDEWDVERTMEQRLVQVMFTVPKERLRVVNAEIEKEEEVVVVDPEKDGFGRENEGDPEGEKKGYGDDEGKGKEKEEGGGGGGSLEPSAAAGPGHHAHAPGGLSPSPSVRSSAATATIHTAEAVRLERPRTRVLEMVESIESHSSREGSPSSSPTRKLS